MPLVNEGINEEGRTSFEVGQSSTRHEVNNRRQRDENDRHISQQERAQRMGGIQKPPKKR